MPEFKRKNIRLPANHYRGRRGYFVTMVTEGRARRFDDPVLISETLALLRGHAESNHFSIPAYCFMPDHLHLLASGTREDSDLLHFVNEFKQESAFVFAQRLGARLWQKKFYDHVLRAGERWESVACYIWLNPVRQGHCTEPEGWPHSGSFTLDWRKLVTIGIKPWAPVLKPNLPG